MRTLILCAVLLSASCAGFKSVARTALDVAREACDLFAAGQPEAERPLGMSLDECADRLLSAQKMAVSRTLAAKRATP